MKNILATILAFALFAQIASAKKGGDSFDVYLLNHDVYIAARGWGETAKIAEQDALEGIAKYFSSEISVKSVEITVSDSAGTRSVLTDESFVKSEAELFAEAVAERDPLKKASLLFAARNYAEEHDIERKMLFAAILYPKGFAQFSDVSENLSSFAALVSKPLSGLTVAVKCGFADDGKIISAAFSALSEFGIVAGNGGADYVCQIVIDENSQTLQAGTFYTPSYTVIFLKDDRPILSSAGSVKKVGAKSPDVARTRAVNAVAKEIPCGIRKTLTGKNETR